MKCSMVRVAVYRKISRRGVGLSELSETDSVFESVPSGFIVVVVIEGGELRDVLLSNWRSEAISRRVLWLGASRDG